MAGFTEYDELLKKLQNPASMGEQDSSWDSSIAKLSQGQDFSGASKGASKFPKTESQLGTSPTSEGTPAPGQELPAPKPDIQGYSTDAEDAAMAAQMKPGEIGKNQPNPSDGQGGGIAEMFKGGEGTSSGGGIMDLIKKFSSMGSK